MNYQQIYQSTLISNLTDSKIIEGIQSLHHLYTQDRGSLKQDSINELMASSYALFYMSTNMPKMNYLIDQLDEEIKQMFMELPLLDIGTGPGTFLWPLYQLGRTGKSIGVDRSTHMLKQAEKIRNNIYPKAEIIWTENLPIEFPANGILFFGNSLNEIGVGKIGKLIERYAPKVVAWIEPGTKEISESLISKREEFRDLGFNVIFPCQNIQSACPMLLRKDESWCHQILRITHDHEVERLSQIVGLDRKILPMNAHVYVKADKGRTSKVNSATMVRFLRETKHSFEWEVCLQESEILVLKEFEIPKRELSKEQLKQLEKSSVGKIFQYDLIKTLSESRWRISLK